MPLLLSSISPIFPRLTLPFSVSGYLFLTTCIWYLVASSSSSYQKYIGTSQIASSSKLLFCNIKRALKSKRTNRTSTISFIFYRIAKNKSSGDIWNDCHDQDHHIIVTTRGSLFPLCSFCSKNQLRTDTHFPCSCSLSRSKFIERYQIILSC